MQPTVSHSFTAIHFNVSLTNALSGPYRWGFAAVVLHLFLICFTLAFPSHLIFLKVITLILCILCKQHGMPIRVALRSKLRIVLAHSNTGIVGSDPRDMIMCLRFSAFVLSCVGSDLVAG
jgi:hypothetical protein